MNLRKSDKVIYIYYVLEYDFAIIEEIGQDNEVTNCSASGILILTGKYQQKGHCLKDLDFIILFR